MKKVFWRLMALLVIVNSFKDNVWKDEVWFQCVWLLASVVAVIQAAHMLLGIYRDRLAVRDGMIGDKAFFWLKAIGCFCWELLLIILALILWFSAIRSLFVGCSLDIYGF